MGKTGFDQFIVLPIQGIRVPSPSIEAATGRFLRKLTVRTGPLRPFRLTEAPGMELRLLDSVSEYGAKLVEIAPAALSALRSRQPGLRLVPLAFFHPAVAPRLRVETRAAAAKAAVKVRLRIVSRMDGTPVAGALVVAFTDFEQRIGAQGWTNAKGEVSLALGSASPKLKRLYIYPEKNFWSGLRKNITVSSDTRITLVPLSLDYVDCLRHFYVAASPKAGAGIKVAVVDTGIAEHPDLDIDGGENTVGVRGQRQGARHPRGRDNRRPRPATGGGAGLGPGREPAQLPCVRSGQRFGYQLRNHEGHRSRG
jgi:hypothetical protein